MWENHPDCGHKFKQGIWWISKEFPLLPNISPQKPHKASYDFGSRNASFHYNVFNSFSAFLLQKQTFCELWGGLLIQTMQNKLILFEYFETYHKTGLLRTCSFWILKSGIHTIQELTHYLVPTYKYVPESLIKSWLEKKFCIVNATPLLQISDVKAKHLIIKKYVHKSIV